MKHFYRRAVDKHNNKAMFNFLHNHFQYFTLNSWNQLKSIANDVKLYRIPFKHNTDEVFKALHEDSFVEVNNELYEWDANHPGYKTGFNGRSGGYLVLYNEANNKNILPEEITDYTYDEFKEYCREYYGGMKHYRDLRFYVELVQDFDKLCDRLIDIIDNLCDELAKE